MKDEHQINSKGNWKHACLERSIRLLDLSQDVTRSGIFCRAVRAAEGVDWNAVQNSLVELKKPEDAAGISFSFQAKYDASTEEILKGVRDEMLQQLELIKRLQTQYMLLLLLANYLMKLKAQRRIAQKSSIAEADNVSFPSIAELLVRMMLEDPNCAELKTIRGILVSWRNK